MVGLLIISSGKRDLEAGAAVFEIAHGYSTFVSLYDGFYDRKAQSEVPRFGRLHLPDAVAHEAIEDYFEILFRYSGASIFDASDYL